MHRDTDLHRLVAGIGQILVHALITMLAVTLAFSLPSLADAIQRLWPQLEANTQLMLATEIGLASALVLLFNLAKIAWDNRSRVSSARLASLVHARPAGNGWFSRWRERELIRRLPAARDAFVLTVTGYDTFVDPQSRLRPVLETAYEVRAMLVNPISEGLRQRVESLPPDVTLLSFHSEIEASIVYLTELRKRGKNVTLKFYDHQPFWKVVVLGDYAWVQHCHTGFSVREQPEYVFALRHGNPREGLFVPFYTHVLNQWNESGHPEYDFDRNELVYRDLAGNETGRASLGVPVNGMLPPQRQKKAA